MQADLAQVLRADLVCKGIGHLLQRVPAVDDRAQRQMVQRAHQVLLLLAAADDTGQPDVLRRAGERWGLDDDVVETELARLRGDEEA